MRIDKEGNPAGRKGSVQAAPGLHFPSLLRPKHTRTPLHLDATHSHSDVELVSPECPSICMAATAPSLRSHIIKIIFKSIPVPQGWSGLSFVSESRWKTDRARGQAVGLESTGYVLGRVT